MNQPPIELIPFERREGFPLHLRDLIVRARHIVNQMPYHPHYESALKFLAGFGTGPSYNHQ